MTEILEAVEGRTVLTIDAPGDAKLLTPAQGVLMEAKDLIVDSPDMKQIAAELLAKIIGTRKHLNDERMELTRPLDELKAKLIGKYQPALTALQEAETVLKTGPTGILQYDQRVARERQEEENRQAEIRRRESAAADAAAAKIKAEGEAAAQKLRDEATAAAAAGDVGKAAKLEVQAANKIEASEIKALERVEAVHTLPVYVAPPPPKVSGLNNAKTYNGRCVSVLELAKFVVANPAFINLLQCNQTALNAQAKSMKDAFAIGGCELVVTTNVRSRAA